MKINPTLYGILVVITFFGIIMGFQIAGVWSTSGKVSASGEAIQPDAADVNSIKGWMTLEQISTTYNVPVAEILTQFNLPTDTSPTTAVKDLESDTFDTTNLREWLSSRISSQSDIPVPPAAPTPTISPLPTDVPPDITTPASLPTPEAADHTSTPGTLTGKTTFQELLDWGLPADAIRQIIGGDIPAPSTIVKDYVTGQGMEFSTVKTMLQTELDKLAQ